MLRFQCVICLEISDFDYTCKPTVAPCGHLFHSNCLLDWWANQRQEPNDKLYCFVCKESQQSISGGRVIRLYPDYVVIPKNPRQFFESTNKEILIEKSGRHLRVIIPAAQIKKHEDDVIMALHSGRQKVGARAEFKISELQFWFGWDSEKRGKNRTTSISTIWQRLSQIF